MKRKTVVLSGLALVPVALLALAFGAARLSHRPVEVGLVDGRLRTCEATTNCVCSEDANSEASIAPFELEGDAQAAFGALIELVESEDDAEIVSSSADYLHAVFYTAFMRFADDVEFRLDEASKLIHVRSASRVGRSDLGANRSRVEALRVRYAAP